jgi:hypothetical protein
MSYISAHTMIKPITKAPKRREVGPLLSEHAVRRFFGLVFGFAAIGLWLLPSANELAQVLLLKTGFTAILCFCCIVALVPRSIDYTQSPRAPDF